MGSVILVSMQNEYSGTKHKLVWMSLIVSWHRGFGRSHFGFRPGLGFAFRDVSLLHRRRRSAAIGGGRSREGGDSCSEESITSPGGEQGPHHVRAAKACAHHFEEVSLWNESLCCEIQWRDGVPAAFRPGATCHVSRLQHVFQVHPLCHHAMPTRGHGQSLVGEARSQRLALGCDPGSKGL